VRVRRGGGGGFNKISRRPGGGTTGRRFTLWKLTDPPTVKQAENPPRAAVQNAIPRASREARLRFFSFLGAPSSAGHGPAGRGGSSNPQHTSKRGDRVRRQGGGAGPCVTTPIYCARSGNRAWHYGHPHGDGHPVRAFFFGPQKTCSHRSGESVGRLSSPSVARTEGSRRRKESKRQRSGAFRISAAQLRPKGPASRGPVCWEKRATRRKFRRNQHRHDESSLAFVLGRPGDDLLTRDEEPSGSGAPEQGTKLPNGPEFISKRGTNTTKVHYAARTSTRTWAPRGPAQPLSRGYWPHCARRWPRRVYGKN